MLKTILTHLLIGGAITAFGFILVINNHDGLLFTLGLLLWWGGIGYAVTTISIILYPSVKKAVDERKTNRGRAVEKREIHQAQDDLLRYKKLLDEGILSQEEFTKKSEELKKIIL